MRSFLFCLALIFPLLAPAFFFAAPPARAQSIPANPGPCTASFFNTCRWAYSLATGPIFHNSVDNPSTPIFGVHINEETGQVSGYAWNDILGYLDFSNATFDVPTGRLNGTALILSLGAAGAILLRGDCAPSCGGYGVNISPSGVVTGHAWNDAIGYINFNPPLGGVLHSQPQEPSVSGWAWNNGYGWIALRFTSYDPEYGVQLKDDGTFSGQAYNPTDGFINYAPTPTSFPSAPQHAALWDDQTGAVTGWIQITSLGNNGWINMAGVNIDPQTGLWTGTATSLFYGSLDFAHSTAQVVSALTQGSVTTPVLSEPLNCVDTYQLNPVNPTSPTLQWSAFASDDGGTQGAYQVQVDDDPDFASPLVSQIVASANNVYTVPLGTLVYNSTYYWRVRVQNTLGNWSDWGEQGTAPNDNCLRTPLHAPPTCGFTFLPDPPPLNEETQFFDQSQAYGGASIIHWYWVFGDGETDGGGDPVIHQNPYHVFQLLPGSEMSLTVRDFHGYSCTTAAAPPPSVQELLPELRRIVPR